jgi:hypothetical protein
MPEIEPHDTVIYCLKEYKVLHIDYDSNVIRIIPVGGGQILFVNLDQVYLCQKKTKN